MMDMSLFQSCFRSLIIPKLDEMDYHENICGVGISKLNLNNEKILDNPKAYILISELNNCIISSCLKKVI